MDEQWNYWRNARVRRLQRRRVLTAAGAGAAGLALAAALGCGQKRSTTSQTGGAASQAAAGPPVRGGTYNFYQPSNAPTLDPQRTTSYFCMQPCGGVYSRLFGLKVGPDPIVSESAEIEPDLGLSAESPDAVTWTVKLRTDAKFQNIAPVNGHAVEVTDIKASWERAVDPKNPNSGEMDMIDPNQIQTPAPDTIVFTLKYPYAPFPKILAGPKYGWILPREATSGAYDPAKQMIGSGPFILDNYTPDVAFAYRRNPDWFVKDRPYIDGIRYAIITDTAQQLAQFTAGNLDEIDMVAGNNIDTLRRQNPKAKFFAADSVGQQALIGQLGDPSSPWTDVRVRQAMSMLMDRSAIASSVYSGHASPTALLPPKFGKWSLKAQDLDANLAKLYKYDAAAAKTLLQQAGDSTLPFTKLLYPGNGYPPPFPTLAETVNSMLNAAGIKTNLVNIDYNSEYVAGGKGVHYGNFDKNSLVFGQAGNGYVDADQILFAYYNSKSTRRNTPIDDPTFDAMQTKERALTDENQRLQACLEMQRYLIEKMYFVAGWPEEPRYRLVQPWVQNYNFWADYGFMTSSYTQLWLKRS